MNSGKLALAKICIRRVRVVGGSFAAAPTHVSGVAAEQNLGVAVLDRGLGCSRVKDEHYQIRAVKADGVRKINVFSVLFGGLPKKRQ